MYKFYPLFYCIVTRASVNVRLAWQEVKATAANLPRVEEFITYFEETWLVGIFSLNLWNVYEMDSNSPRTNNHIEGWHNKLQRIAKKPNF